MFDEAAERFPQYVSLQESAKKKEPLPGTSYAQKANERIQYMMDEKYQIPLLDTSIGENIHYPFLIIKDIKYPLQVITPNMFSLIFGRVGVSLVVKKILL